MYGWATVEGESFCFYEGKGISRTSDGHTRVWAKCLLQRDLENIDLKSDLGKKIVERGAQKLNDSYIPPIAIIEDFNYNDATVIIGYEQTADLAGLKPVSEFYFELNCSEQMFRLTGRSRHRCRSTPTPPGIPSPTW
jgi:hypothetical protein